MRVLLVEDDRMIGESIRAALRQDGSAVDWVRDGRSAESTLGTEQFDLVLLDLGLPHQDGIEILRAMRSRHDQTPVIVLTARDALSDRVAGLDAGADDYLVKPFALDELTARVRALLRRRSDTELLRFADLEMGAVGARIRGARGADDAPGCHLVARPAGRPAVRLG